jgi:hypothetical protein
MIKRSGFHLPVSLLVFLLAALAPPRPARADDLPPMLQQDLENVCKKKISDLLAQKDADGVNMKRGAYSKTFKKVDDSTYQVTFHQDTVENGKGKSDQLKTERLLLTIKKDASGKWAIANEEVKDTYVQLFRGIFNSRDVYAFDKMSFEREGLKVTASNGQLYKIRLLGEEIGFKLIADDLTYQYAPPKDSGYGYYDMIKQRLVAEHPEDLVFKPANLKVQCDPTSCAELETTIFTGLRNIGGGSEGASGGGSGSGASIRKVFDEDVSESDKYFKQNPFGSFRQPYKADQRFWSFHLKSSSAKDRWVELEYDNYQPWEVSFNTSTHGTLFAYYAEATRNSGIPQYDLERRDDKDSRDYELNGLKGTVELAVVDPYAVRGDIVYEIKTKRALDQLHFQISRIVFPGEGTKDVKNPKLFINSIQDGNGNELTWVKLRGYEGIVFFPKELPGGTDLSLRLQFTNYDSIYKLNPSYSAMDRSGWLPFVRFGDMIDHFDLIVKVPDNYRDLGIGKKISEEKKDGLLITRWASASPVSFPTVIFGDYIDDGPSFKATKKDGTEIPVRVYVDKVSTQSLDSFEAAAAGARDIRGKQLKAIAEQAANALNLYREVYGVDYPFDKLDLVADPLGSFYGQAPASIVYLGFGVFRGEGEVAGGFGGGSSISKFNKDVVAHEVAHQWWGSLVCNSNFRNYWFVESLAEYSSAIFVENINGKNGRKKYLEKVADWRQNILEADLVTPVQNGYTVWAGESARGSYPPVANIYNKGPYAFHVLRETFGDEKFFRFLKELATSLQHEQIVTRDIQQVMEKVYGGNMEWFFDQWLRGVGTPQYALRWTVRQTEDGKFLVEGSIKQRVVFGKDNEEMKGTYYRAVAPLTFVTEDGKKVTAAKPMLVQGPETPFKLKLDFKPSEVLFNDEGQILAKPLLVNRGW